MSPIGFNLGRWCGSFTIELNERKSTIVSIFQTISTFTFGFSPSTVCESRIFQAPWANLATVCELLRQIQRQQDSLQRVR